MDRFRIPSLVPVFLGSLITFGASDPLSEAFQRGLVAEEIRSDFRAASASYGEVIRLAEAQRDLVATSLFRLSEAQRRLGCTNEAIAGYRRLIREFGAQTKLVALATERLRAWGVAEAAGRDGTSERAKRLMERYGQDAAAARDKLRRLEGDLQVPRVVIDTGRLPEAASPELRRRLQPYFEARKESETLHRIWEDLQVHLVQQPIDPAAEPRRLPEKAPTP